MHRRRKQNVAEPVNVQSSRRNCLWVEIGHEEHVEVISWSYEELKFGKKTGDDLMGDALASPDIPFHTNKLLPQVDMGYQNAKDGIIPLSKHLKH